MKRLLCAFLTVVMLVSVLSTVSFGAGTLVFSDNFDEGLIPRNWIAGEYEWDGDNGCVIGYQPARVLQSNFQKKYGKMWDQFYAKVDVQFRGFDDVFPATVPHTVKIWYRDRFETSEIDGQGGAIYFFVVEVETGRAYLQKDHEWTYYDGNGVKKEHYMSEIIAEGQYDGVIRVAERAPFYEVGIRVTEGKIEGYFDGQLLISAEADLSDERLGDIALHSVDSTVGTEKSPFVLFNGEQFSASYIAFDNFQVWTPDYDFTSSVVYGDADGDGEVKLGDVSLMLKHIAGWSDLTIDLTAADVDVNGSVNLTDASTTLKVIAGWEGVVLGPQ